MSIPIDTLLSRHFCETRDGRSAAYLVIGCGVKKKKLFRARDYSCEITEIDKTRVSIREIFRSLTNIAKVFIGPHGYE